MGCANRGVGSAALHIRADAERNERYDDNDDDFHGVACELLGRLEVGLCGWRWRRYRCCIAGCSQASVLGSVGRRERQIRRHVDVGAGNLEESVDLITGDALMFKQSSSNKVEAVAVGGQKVSTFVF